MDVLSRSEFIGGQKVVQSWLSRPWRRLGTFFTDEIRDVLVNRILLVTVSDSRKIVEDPWNVFGFGFKHHQRTSSYLTFNIRNYFRSAPDFKFGWVVCEGYWVEKEVLHETPTDSAFRFSCIYFVRASD